MSKMHKQTHSWLQINVLRIARVHFYFILAYVATIIIYEGWQLITPQAMLRRWTLAAIMLIVTTVVWYAARSVTKNELYYRVLAFTLIILDIYVAAFSVYAERGMASRGVALFAIPIAVSAMLYSRSALFATAALCSAAYSLAAVRYFVVNFNEGYRIELYSVIGFYGAGFFILASILWAVIHGGQNR